MNHLFKKTSITSFYLQEHKNQLTKKWPYVMIYEK